MSNEANEAVVSELENMHAEHRKLRAQLADTAAFLDGLAERIDGALHISVVADAAADCRAMAAKLRGET